MIICGNCIEVMKSIKSNSVDIVFADPPYFLSNGGLSISNGKVVSVDKGEWDKKYNYNNIRQFTFDWLSECSRVLKNTGTIWISCTHHNLYELKWSLDNLNFTMINTIIWNKINPPPLIFHTRFRFSYEMILWYRKSSLYFFNYDILYKENNAEMSDVWILPAVSKEEKKFGKHTTQKPEILLERIIKCSTNKGDLVLDPFVGSGTTCVVAKKLERKFIGIDINQRYCEIANKRLAEIQLFT